jgi:pimeloyl-ACP methyl ester carboxylesterase
MLKHRFLRLEDVMSKFDVVWLNVSPSLKRLDQPLLKQLSGDRQVFYWQYIQTLDEASSLDEAVRLLGEYLGTIDRPVHLMGHGLSGVVGLLFAQRHPEKVRSMTLLAVSPEIATTWHAYYYLQRSLSPCSQTRVLAQMVHNLFGKQLPGSIQSVMNALEKDLDLAPHPHSLYRLDSLPKMLIEPPLLVCGGINDSIVPPSVLRGWIDGFKTGDTVWFCPMGQHFFHFLHAPLVAEQLLQFWQQIDRLESETLAIDVTATTKHTYAS